MEEKDDNYKSRAEIILTRNNETYYTLEYTTEGEEWALYGTVEEIAGELSEHMECMLWKK